MKRSTHQRQLIK